MVKFDERHRFAKLKEVSEVDEVNKLLKEGWELVEATASSGEKSFVMGFKKKETSGELHEQVKKAVEEELKERKEKQEREKIAEVEKGKSERLNSVIIGVIALLVGLFLVLSVNPLSNGLFTVLEYNLIDEITLIVGIILLVLGLGHLMQVFSRKKSNNSKSEKVLVRLLKFKQLILLFSFFLE